MDLVKSSVSLNTPKRDGGLWLVVSDGDGGRGLSMSIQNGIPMIIHAHGDNRKALEELIPRVGNLPIAITHQTPFSIDGMMNPGGFTDGDRDRLHCCLDGDRCREHHSFRDEIRYCWTVLRSY